VKGRSRRARRAVGLGALAVVAAVALVGTVVPTSSAEGRSGGPLEEVRSATRRYRDVNKAIDAGYVQFFGCVHEPLAGAMGVHFVNGALAGDAIIDRAKPEALTYEVQPNGQLALAGAEYVVFQEAWDAQHDRPPTLFGQTFVLVPAGNRYGLPAFYALHAWAWRSNPAGSFADWNPKVLCLGTEGHEH
jgi:hypothetical protein